MKGILLHKLVQKMMNSALGRKPVVTDAEPTKKQTAEEIFAQMTDSEKISFISGVDNFCIKAIPRLGVPVVWTSDATSGIRGWDTESTIFPSNLAMTASFDKDLIKKCGEVIGHECRAVGVSVLLAPGVNIARNPVCGRNFEYMGEDPFLAGVMAASYIFGVQSTGVATTVKHFACNNSDYNRHKSNSIVDKRTLHEIYLPAFKKAVEAGSLGVMTSYNQVNGVYASENEYLVQTVLRQQWGFDGLVISDWTSLYSTEGPAKYGVDLEMPGGKWFEEKRISQALESGKISMEDLNKKVKHILLTLEKIGVFGRSIADPNEKIATKENFQTALDMAHEGLVLLKNDSSILPVDSKKINNIVIMGYNKDKTPTGGGGSSFVLANQKAQTLGEVLSKTIKGVSITEEDGDSESSKARIKDADLVLVLTGYDNVIESESYDRLYDLPDNDAEKIKLASALNGDRVVVVVLSGGAFETRSWVDEAKCILHASYLGSQGAQAIADVILGAFNPSGKLPFTIAGNMNEYPALEEAPTNYWKISPKRLGLLTQGKPVGKILDIPYSEGLCVGYRHFDTKGLRVDFPFGHGLSYTKFDYSDLRIEKKERTLEVSFTVTNCGLSEGAEVAQVYVSAKDSKVFKPEQELRGFERINLNAGKSKEVKIELDSYSFSHHSEDKEEWLFDKGSYEIRVGSSSRDIRLSGEAVLN